MFSFLFSYLLGKLRRGGASAEDQCSNPPINYDFPKKTVFEKRILYFLSRTCGAIVFEYELYFGFLDT